MRAATGIGMGAGIQMMHLWNRLLSVFGLGRSRQALATPAEFTHEFCQALRQHQPGARVMIVGDLELVLHTADDTKAQIYLNNAYETYRQNPGQKATIMQRLIQVGWDSMVPAGGGLVLTQIVPVIKSRDWLLNASQAAQSRGGPAPPEPVHEVLNEELIVLYAEDSPQAIRYVNQDDLAKAKIELGSLRALACANLKRLLPNIECRGGEGVYLFSADGNYESSLLLFDSLWTDGQLEVQGEPVVAIPTRSMLLVTGSQNAMAIAKLKEIAEEGARTQSYAISDKLFVYRQGKFDIFAG